MFWSCVCFFLWNSWDQGEHSILQYIIAHLVSSDSLGATFFIAMQWRSWSQRHETWKIVDNMRSSKHQMCTLCNHACHWNDNDKKCNMPQHVASWRLWIHEIAIQISTQVRVCVKDLPNGIWRKGWASLYAWWITI